MDRQKLIQKSWYDYNVPPGKEDIIKISNETHIKQLKKLLPIKQVLLSLNCGCGKGSQNNIFGPSIGMDISFENIRSLKEAGGQGVIADMEFLPFKDNIFDLVYGFGILHHLNDIRKGVSEAVRVLKRGGYLGFGGENNGLCPLNYIMPFVYRNWKVEKGFYRIREDIIKKLFRELGIKEFKINRHGMTIYGLGKVIFRVTSLLERILSRIKFLNLFSGHCYFSGKKI